MEQPTLDVTGDWPMIAAQLPTDWREIAVRHHLVDPTLPAYMRTKITDVEQALRLMLYHVGTDTSLATTVAVGKAARIVDISAVALHHWMRKSGPFLYDLLARLVDAEQTFRAERWAGYDIHVVDASCVERPGAKGTTARVHYALRLTTLRPVHIEITDEHGGETFRRFRVRPDELWMGDRGYANPPGIAHVTDAGGEVMVRLNRGALPLYDVHGRPLDLHRCWQRLRRSGPPRQWFAQVQPEGHAPIRGRLCMVRLPDDRADEARERLRREQGAPLSADAKEAAAFVMVFTTVPDERLTTAQVLELYALRWQVELSIKRDKSICGLGRLPHFRPDAIATWLGAKLLLIQIARRLLSPQVAFPPGARTDRAAA